MITLTTSEISGSHGGEYEVEFSGMYRCVVLMLTDVSEERTASVIRAMTHTAYSHAAYMVPWQSLDTTKEPRHRAYRSFNINLQFSYFKNILYGDNSIMVPLEF
jgi:hypothetical protein